MQGSTRSGVVLEMPKIDKAWLMRAYSFDAEELVAAMESIAWPVREDCADAQPDQIEPVKWWPEAA